jgi:hypothetical protein
VAKLSKGHLTTIIPLPPLLEDTVWTSSFAEDALGNIWFAYDPEQKVFRCSQSGLEAFTEMERFGSPLRKGADFLMERDSGRSIRAVGL